MSKKRKDDGDRFSGIGFDEALARLIQTDPKEIADAFEQNRKRSEEIRESADERRKRLRSNLRKR